MTFKIKLDENAFPLSKAYFTDAWYDIKTPISFEIKPKSTFIINTGVHIQIPHEYAGLIVSKSGLNINHDITSTGLIDEGYIEPIIVKLYNNANNTYYFNRGDKITQLLLVKTSYFNIKIINSLNKNSNSDSNNEIQRGYNGFGNSGK